MITFTDCQNTKIACVYTYICVRKVRIILEPEQSSQTREAATWPQPGPLCLAGTDEINHLDTQFDRHFIFIAQHKQWRLQYRYSLVPQIDPSVPQPVVQSRRRPLLAPSPGWKRLLALSHLTLYCRWVDISTRLLRIREAIKKKIYNQNVRTHLSSDY